MDFVKLTHENIENEHICCAIANNKDVQVMSKKNWLKERLDEGLVRSLLIGMAYRRELQPEPLIKSWASSRDGWPKNLEVLFRNLC